MNHKLAVLALFTIFLSGCAVDKRAHFVAGTAVSGIVTEYTGSHLKGCAASFGVGFLKEYVVDEIVHGKPDFADVIATGAGCTIWSVRW